MKIKPSGKEKDITVYKRTSKNIATECDCCGRRCVYVITFRKRLITVNLCVKHRRRLRRMIGTPGEIPTQEEFMKANIRRAKRLARIK